MGLVAESQRQIASKITIKVRGTARSSGELPCRTCKYATVMKTASHGQERVHCNQISGYIRIDVVECSSYNQRGSTSLRNLYETAWILETNKTRREIGFVPYGKWAKDNKKERADLWELDDLED